MNSTKYSKIFEPIKIGNLLVKNRIETAPAAPMLATGDSLVSNELIEYTRKLAEGGAGIVNVGISLVNNVNIPYLINLSEDKVVYQLSVLAETIKRYGAVASIELSSIEFGSGDTNTPDNFTSIVDTITKEEIKGKIEEYVKAAERCVLAGMDMVLIHGGHGVFVSNFFSPLLNHRTDEYGGSLENRARFAVELLESIRKKVGNKIAIEYRVSADELVEGGATLEDTIEFAKLIQDKIDLLHVSAGLLTNDEILKYTVQPIYFKRGYNVHFAEKFKKELKVPVAAVGSIDLLLAEEIVEDGKADIVSMIRTFLADNEAVNKARKGKEDTIRPCIRCNMCLNRTHYYPLPVRCSVNPIVGREVELKNWNLPRKSKNVAIIGGGPAGMEAARTAAELGHKVTLFEKSDKLGGILNVASLASFKKDVKDYLDWSVRMTLSNSNINVNLNTEATPESITKENADTLIIAVGAKPLIPNIKGIKQSNVVSSIDVEANSVTIGDKVTVIGGGQTGCETALSLAMQGKDVTLVEMVSEEQMLRNAPIINMNAIISLLKESNVHIETNTKLVEVTEKGIIVEQKGAIKNIACDNVVLALGVVPDTETVNKFSNLAEDVVVIGDSKAARGNLFTATTSGFNAAINIK